MSTETAVAHRRLQSETDSVQTGVVLDMDLKCNRALGPLRQFEFVSPRAHPVGISNSFIMASKNNDFIRTIIDNLERYNKHWFWLPYPTVMFSTGCHYVSYVLPSRSKLERWLTRPLLTEQFTHSCHPRTEPHTRSSAEPRRTRNSTAPMATRQHPFSSTLEAPRGTLGMPPSSSGLDTSMSVKFSS